MFYKTLPKPTASPLPRSHFPHTAPSRPAPPPPRAGVSRTFLDSGQLGVVDADAGHGRARAPLRAAPLRAARRCRPRPAPQSWERMEPARPGRTARESGQKAPGGAERGRLAAPRPPSGEADGGVPGCFPLPFPGGARAAAQRDGQPPRAVIYTFRVLGFFYSFIVWGGGLAALRRWPEILSHRRGDCQTARTAPVPRRSPVPRPAASALSSPNHPIPVLALFRRPGKSRRVPVQPQSHCRAVSQPLLLVPQGGGGDCVGTGTARGGQCRREISWSRSTVRGL